MDSNNIKAYQVSCFPIIKEICNKLNLVETINNLVPTNHNVEAGIIVQGLIYDTLSLRNPLYLVEKFHEGADFELLYNRKITSKYFTDDNIGRILDEIYEVGTNKIFSKIALNGLNYLGEKVKYIRHDTTSVNVWGEYDVQEKEKSKKPFLIKRGYSKDKRPDLNQFLISLLCVKGNLPVSFKLKDGNGSDKTINNEVLSHMSNSLVNDFNLSEKEFIYIADSALVTKDNLEKLGNNNFFISLLPSTFSIKDKLIKNALSSGNFHKIGNLSEGVKKGSKRKKANYKIYEEDFNLYGNSYRGIVVHSDLYDKRKLNSLSNKLKRSEANLSKLINKFKKKEYYCKKDAEEVVKELLKESSDYHNFEIDIQEHKKYCGGRVKAGCERKVKTIKYSLEIKLVEKKLEVEKLKEECGCFVLITNVPKTGQMCHSSQEILLCYKDQNYMEQNFSFLKDPVIVNDIFLKKIERIESLGLVLMLSLFIWRFIEKLSRRSLSNGECELFDMNDRKTERPTTLMLVKTFSNILILKIGEKRILNTEFKLNRINWLKALNISEKVFTDPYYSSTQ